MQFSNDCDGFPPIPSLKGLTAFEAVIRLRSVTAAAREVGCSQAVISQRLRALEDTLGAPLLERHPGKGVCPTEAGQQLYGEIGDTVCELLSRTRVFQQRLRRAPQEISIAANFGIMHLWLRPRSAALQAAFPQVRFRFLSSDTDDNAWPDNADITIRFNNLAREVPVHLKLNDETVFPVCSPDFSAAHDMDTNVTASQMTSLPLLHLDVGDDRWLDWYSWCRLAKLPLPPTKPAFTYNNYPLMLQDAMSGKGLALGWESLVAAPLARGVLVRKGPVVRRQGHAYFMVTRHPDTALIKHIMDWFTRQLSSD